MPTYEYKCPHCGYGFEAFQKITASPIQDCPKCNKKVKRLISGGSGIIFKGTGFYATDYRKGAKQKKGNTQCGACPAVKNACPEK